MTDPDEFAKQDCACGHRRTKHTSIYGECHATVKKTDTSGLPKPELDDPRNPFEYPKNWPAALSLVERPCQCARFSTPDHTGTPD